MGNELQADSVKKLTSLLSALSNKDAFIIFMLAGEGLKAEGGTLQKIGFTRKQYYKRLKQLADNGLIKKEDNFYRLTTLGTLVNQKYIIPMLEVVRNTKEMEMVDALKRTKQFSQGEILDLLTKLGLVPQIQTNTS